MKIYQAHPRAPKVFSPVGFCIYCKSNGGKRGLTKEHPIPVGLGNGYILPKASCYDCAKITGTIEQMNLRMNFQGARSYLTPNYPTRRPKERPSHFPIAVKMGAYQRREMIPLEKFPFVIVTPGFREPGIFVGAPLGAPFSTTFQVAKGPDLEQRLRQRQQTFGRDVSVSQQFNVMAFMRLLAKIAHSLAAAMVGLEKFTPMLPDLILGKNLDLGPYLIGQSRHVPLLPKAGADHDIHFRLVNPTASQGLQYLVAAIRLFSKLQSPNYAVIVGKYTSTLPLSS